MDVYIIKLFLQGHDNKSNNFLCNLLMYTVKCFLYVCLLY